jgi:N-acetylglucosaminyl-diphospho-decaprenol L-rhamnosyltransferase
MIAPEASSQHSFSPLSSILYETDLMAKERPWVRIVIVNYNASRLLQDCVNALACQSMPSFEVVIVDNASKTHPVADLQLPDARFHILQAGANIGFAAASNLGAGGSTAPWIACLNPDTLPRPDWLAELRAATERHASATMFGSTQLQMAHPDTVDGFGDVLSAFGSAWRSWSGRRVRELPQGDCETFSACAAAALYARPCFEHLGGFDESFFCYLEDVDLGLRARLLGERCVQVRAAEVLHEASATTGHLSAFSVFHSYRNRIWLFAKNMPWPLVLPIVGLQSVAIAVGLARPRARSYRRAALSGILAGLRGLPRMVQSRRKIQRERRASTWEIARMMVWNPLRAGAAPRIHLLNSASSDRS